MRAPLRLLYLLPAEGFGGAERQGVYHLAELPRHGVRTTAFVGPGDAVIRALADAGARHDRFDHFPALNPRPLGPFGRVLYGASWVRSVHRAAVEIERAVRGSRFDLIFANRTLAWLVAAQLSRRLRTPYAIRAGSRPVQPLLRHLLPLLDRAAPPAAIFTNCRAVEQVMAPCFRCRAYSLPNAVDVDRFAPTSPSESKAARRRLGLAQVGPLIGLAARPAPGKGFDLLERVVLLVHRSRPSAQFVVAGDFGWRRAFEARFSALGLKHTVRFLGQLDGIEDFFHAVDVVLLTSREHSIEASPNALLEAMAAGRAVVATRVGGVPELVLDGLQGYLVSDGDSAAFARRVLDILDDGERRTAFGRAGRALAVSHHRTSTVVSQFARDLAEVASESAARETSHEGASSCESTTRFVPFTTSSFTELRSKPSW
jgi:glycosyltransferase involved in cell wall biosynthesis